MVSQGRGGYVMVPDVFPLLVRHVMFWKKFGITLFEVCLIRNSSYDEGFGVVFVDGMM